MPALTYIYLVGLAWMVGGACELLAAWMGFKGVAQGPVAVWLALLLLVYCPRISTHHRQLAKVSSGSGAVVDAKDRSRDGATEND